MSKKERAHNHTSGINSQAQMTGTVTNYDFDDDDGDACNSPAWWKIAEKYWAKIRSM